MNSVTMIASIHQPSYWPWLGLLDKIAKSDVFVLLDDAQVVKGTYQYRNIFYCNGKAKSIALPIKFSLGCTFAELTFKSGVWQNDHLSKLYNYYRQAPFFDVVYGDLEQFYGQKHATPLSAIKASMFFAFKKLGVNVQVKESSSYNINSRKGDKVLELCKKVNAEVYLAGSGSFDYMQEYLPKFEKENIDIRWHTFQHPQYKQNPKHPFVDGLGCLDIFFFHGYEGSRTMFWDNINRL